jgi:hypothetical protein
MQPTHNHQPSHQWHRENGTFNEGKYEIEQPCVRILSFGHGFEHRDRTIQLFFPHGFRALVTVDNTCRYASIFGCAMESDDDEGVSRRHRSQALVVADDSDGDDRPVVAPRQPAAAPRVVPVVTLESDEDEADNKPKMLKKKRGASASKVGCVLI